MRGLLLLSGFILLHIGVFAQQTPYQAFEVDSAAEPHGGMPFLNTFLQTNLRKPVAAEAKGIGGRIVFNAIVEPDGRVSDVKPMNSLRPDLDREATRVFSLFKAWKPAKKNGKAVRQQVMIPVTFKPNVPYTYSNGARVSYFDADKKPIADSNAQVRYKQIAPVDTNGFANGDIIIYKAKGSDWKEEYRLPFVRQAINRKGASSQSTITIGYQNSDKLWEGEVVTLSDSGSIINQSFYKNGLLTNVGLKYHPNGLVAEKRAEREDGYTVTSWYTTGQVREIRFESKPKPPTKQAPNSVSAYWDHTGQQLVKEGNGRAIYSETTRSRADTARQTTFIEQGLYENGLKQGVWTGRYADGSYFYEEQYDKGNCQQGKAQVAGGDTLRYTEFGSPPEFVGGMAGLGQFLSENLHYPVEAQRAGRQGRVLLSFVVCEDGALCDYEVIKSVDPELDKEALRIVQKMNGRWKPGVQRGQKVRVKYSLPINFSFR
ncbi:energy transducer TonB [Spirosoma endbachense]|uniref:TonB family protein n=1 Tax=Spirosoma endbachense TaxID=2666025 RepID=A0A6P1W4G6_9BACT|nr:energy transducer TonB [Spirosoma endbachense]QHV98897.1 TonB family protein [Spirosoma endbachense]